MKPKKNPKNSKNCVCGHPRKEHGMCGCLHKIYHKKGGDFDFCSCKGFHTVRVKS